MLNLIGENLIGESSDGYILEFDLEYHDDCINSIMIIL